ncbi:MAG: CNNM domain-containing protein, partial [Actinomycetes bacterium]
MIETVGLLLLGILVILVIIAANGYFVAQEFAYMSVDRVKLAAQAKAGDKAAARALKVTQRTSFMLSGAQLGITVTGLLVGFVAALPANSERQLVDQIVTRLSVGAPERVHYQG